MIYLLLAYEFFKIGLFSFGGGYATIPFLYHLSEQYAWYSTQELTKMIAVASITPGPVGINIATYAGIKASNVFGALIATTFEMLPSLILVIIVAKLLKKFSDNKYVRYTIESLKPISCALLVSVVVKLTIQNLHDKMGIILLASLLLLSWKTKKDPIYYILISATVGVLLVLI